LFPKEVLAAVSIAARTFNPRSALTAIWKQRKSLWTVSESVWQFHV